MKTIKIILEKVKQHKKYKTITDDLVIDEINEYLKKNQITDQSKITRQDIKQIRANLHRLYSSYQTKKQRKKQEYLDELDKNIKNNKPITKTTNNLLSITLSTKERLEDYPTIYKQIFKITKKPKTIIDLGAGLNALSYPLMNLKSLVYYSYDIDEEDARFLNEYFKIMKSKALAGRAAIWNLKEISKIDSLPSADIILMFKVIDLIDKKHKKISEELITRLIKNKKTRFIVASFATKTLTRKPMKLPRRKGFELMLERNNLDFRTFSTCNEIFYIISKEG